MKENTNKNLSLALAFVSLLVTAPLLADRTPLVAASLSYQDASRQSAEEPQITVVSTRDLPAPAINTRLAITDKAPAALSGELRKGGFAPQTGPASFFGKEIAFRSAQGAATATIVLQDYAKPRSRDKAALGKVIVTSGPESATYSFYLLAPEGDFQNAVEYRVDEGFNVVKANSLWSCFVARLKSTCVGPCISALLSCPTTSWSAYLGCVVTKCGACALKALACCACKCAGWCKWKVGCCHQ